VPEPHGKGNTRFLSRLLLYLYILSRSTYLSISLYLSLSPSTGIMVGFLLKEMCRSLTAKATHVSCSRRCAVASR
jgi:hypothetical protein